jgi:hypothetical protein
LVLVRTLGTARVEAGEDMRKIPGADDARTDPIGEVAGFGPSPDTTSARSPS